MKILVVIPYWDGDRVQAETTALLAGDLLEKRSESVSLCFLHRMDSQQPRPKVVDKAMEKFDKVLVRRCGRSGSGFPHGCNEMAYFILAWPAHDPKLFKDFDATLILESDCVFTRKNWDTELVEEWVRCVAAGKTICGNIIHNGFGGYPRHVNAASLFGKEISILAAGPLRGGPADIGWDYYHGRNLDPIAYDSPIFFLDYRKATITPRELFAPRKMGLSPLVYHGVKDSSAVQAVRDRYHV